MWGKNNKKDKDEEKQKKNSSGTIQTSDNKPTEPDVILDIPEVKVDEIKVKVRNLDAHVSVNAKIADFVKVNVGANVHIGKVDIEIEGVRAEAYLKARLERVKTILNRTIQTLDHNPEILKSLLKPVAEGAGKATGEVGKGAGSAVGSIGQGAKDTLQGVGQGAKGIVTKAGDAISNIKLGVGIKKMLKNVNVF
ncbi:hypothetical protein RCC89_17650 [Cytophagaceae bacterium ABcell3]|nr:hypothetical protein RCC89_17650 [Cytophagaceae bacterium ABcell3]